MTVSGYAVVLSQEQKSERRGRDAHVHVKRAVIALCSVAGAIEILIRVCASVSCSFAVSCNTE